MTATVSSGRPAARSATGGRHLKLMAAVLPVLFAFNGAVGQEDLPALIADRKAVELVYYHHRIGQQQSFDQVLPPATLEYLVKTDLNKEAVLKKHYGVTITEPMIEAEIHRIDTTTRAPDVLAELKAALGNDPARFGQTVVKPILVERELRYRFENDDSLHAPQRHQAEAIRLALLAARQSGASVESLLGLLKQGRTNEVTETTWQLSPRPADKPAEAADLAEVRREFGPKAQVLSPGEGANTDSQFYISDLPPLLQRVFQVQLTQPGAVSAVVETPGGFMIYLARQRTAEKLDVACLTVAKRDYDDWLKSQE